MDALPLVTVDRVSKKFCQRLKSSLWYGLSDLVAEFTSGGQERELRLRPAEFLAVNDVSFELHRGECVALIGHNGAGKSTLLKMLNGLVRPNKGRIAIRGRVGALIELGAGFSPVLAGRENIYINGAILGFTKREIDAKFDEIVDFAELGNAIDAPVQTYSSGMYVRLGFAIAAQLRPDIFLIDESLAVGDLSFRMKCYQYFLDLKRAGKTILLVSHNMIDVHRVCDRVIVLDRGTKAFDGHVPIGVPVYEGLLRKHSHRPNRSGPETPARIESVTLLDRVGSLREDFCTGEDLIADVAITGNQPIEHARLIVHVTAPALGTLGSFASPHKGFAFDIGPAGAVVRFSISKIPLLVGSYSLTVSLYGPHVKDFIDDWIDAASFRIVGPAVNTFGYGVCHTVNFEHGWEQVEDPRSGLAPPKCSSDPTGNA